MKKFSPPSIPSVPPIAILASLTLIFRRQNVTVVGFFVRASSAFLENIIADRKTTLWYTDSRKNEIILCSFILSYIQWNVRGGCTYPLIVMLIEMH